ncbi:MAG TPA: type VI secretion system-associated FHA domain protein TagH [Woeseiaceae bacterium]|nr:type VI secretion system-associated FHA domain protein TagH [Woeseiaceae bacterium]
MPLNLKITSAHKDLMGEDASREFRASGGTIGRALENDWILPDRDRFISGRHATIDFRSGAYYLADTSTNGVYINDEEEPLGRRHPRRLFDGDRLRLGDFLIAVSVDEGEDLDVPAEPQPATPNHLELMVPEEPIKTGIQLLDEEEITGDEEFQSTLFGARHTQKMVRKAAPAKIERRPAAVKPRPVPVRRHADTGSLNAEQLFDEFLNGLGIERGDLHPSADPGEIMLNAGQVLREFVSGVVDLLISRANLKSMFKLDQTTVLPRHNNPLKLSENAEATLKQLLVGREGEYLGPLDSVREVCRDLKFHHDAVAEGMSSAFLEVMDRFDPAELQENFDRSINRKPLIEALSKMKYWQLYCDFYPAMTEPGAAGLPQLFGEEFLRAYEKRLADYKRGVRKDSEAA